MRTILIRLLDYFFSTRPVLFMPVWTVALLGAGQAAGRPISPETAGSLLFATACLFGAVYLVNQIFDKESDRINNKGYFIPRDIIAVQEAVVLAVGLNLAALAVSLLISGYAFVLFIAIAILGILYSAPPLRLKDRAWMGLLANMLAHGSIVYLIGVGWNEDLEWRHLLHSLPYFFAVGAIYLNTTLPDVEGDKQVGKGTVAVAYGPRFAQGLALVFVLLAIGIAVYTRDFDFLLPAILSLPLFALALDRKSVRFSVWATKAALLLLSLAAALYFYWYVLILAAGFWAVRTYYKRRFGMVYP
ncbi:MAG TPA: UbiA family prenyltransferase [candidate division Zixibacteria bacterium]|nr:UbiA family prenyltransferase [candidate division Zixibacteria bacterium]